MSGPTAHALAGPGDDAEIRRLLREAPVPGRISVTYEREPDFFAGLGTLGSDVQVMVGKQPRGEVVAMGCRAIRDMHVPGGVEPLGYLSGLRVAEAHRKGSLLARGYRFLRELHEDGRVPWYVSTIVEGNSAAIGMLTGAPRGGLPAYTEIATLDTYAIHARAQIARSAPGCAIERPGADGVAELVEFLRSTGSRGPLAPLWRARDLAPGSPLTPGFDAGDIVFVRRGDDLVAAGALWDQSSVKQTVVRGYSPAMTIGRPVWSAWSRLAGGAPLPAVGQRIRMAYASFIGLADGDAAAFEVLVRTLASDARAKRLAFIAIGLCSVDPLSDVLRRLPHTKYSSRVYAVSWEGGAGVRERLAGCAPAIDVAVL